MKSLFFAIVFATVFFWGVVLAPTAAQAQSAGGTIQGTVTDPSGALITGAKVTVKNVRTNETFNTTSNTSGLFTVPNLVPSEYSVTAEANGFDTQTMNKITLTVGGQQFITFKMKVGRASETVDVSSAPIAVETSSSTISGVVGEQKVRELPLNGRSWTDLAALQPGVDAIQTQPSFASGPDRGNRGFGQQMTISGARPQQNNYRLDGVSINDYANGAPGSVLGGNLGVDAIQEFSVLTSNYSAEYGKTSGGVVNAVTRSGTNAFHGSLYEFLRNSAFDARNYFDPATIPPFKRNQFGGALGGPIVKNRTFFFADYEGIRQSKAASALNLVPSDTARAGVLHDADGNPFSIAIDPAVQKYLALYPHQNAGVSDQSPDIGLFDFVGQQIVHENFFTTRLDHRVSDHDLLYGSYVFDRTPYTSPDGFNNVLLGNLSSRQIFAMEESHIFSPGLVNTLRFGMNQERVDNDQSLKALNSAAGDASLGTLQGRDAAQVYVAGLTPMLGGIGGNPTYFYHWWSFQGYDDVLMTRGSHTIKLGFAFERMLFRQLALVDANGIFRFPTLQDFLTNGNLTSFNAGIASTLTPRHMRQSIVGGYAQDDWRVKPNLTVNVGVRYEMATVPTDTQGKLANLPSLSAAVPHLGDPFFANPTYKNFEPRIGFSWDPFKDGKTAVRGGFGVFDVLPLIYQYILMTNQSAPFFSYTSMTQCNGAAPPGCIPGTGSFFTGIEPLIADNTLRSTYIENHPHRNYVMQWNLNIQRELLPTLSGMVAYIGSRGIHQPFRVDDADIVLPTLTSAGYVYPNPIGSGNRVNENFGSVRGMLYQGRSYYDALEAQVQKHMTHGVEVQGVYTWAKSIDTSSATVAGDAFANSISSLPWYDLRLNRGLSDFNVGRTFTLNLTWQLPSTNSGPGALKWLANGWQLGGIFTVHDGIPFTPTWGTDGDPQGLNSSDPWAFPNRIMSGDCASAINPGNPNNYIKTQCFTLPTAPTTAFFNTYCDPSLGAPICPNLRGNAGRNSLIGPGTNNLDFSVFKNMTFKRISENFKVQFRAEVFNILNHANFAPPNPAAGTTDIFDSTGGSTGATGVLTETTTDSRQMQFAIKISF